MNQRDMKIIYTKCLVGLIRKGTSRTPEEDLEISRLRRKLALLDFKVKKPYRDKQDFK